MMQHHRLDRSVVGAIIGTSGALDYVEFFGRAAHLDPARLAKYLTKSLVSAIVSAVLAILLCVLILLVGAPASIETRLVIAFGLFAALAVFVVSIGVFFVNAVQGFAYQHVQFTETVLEMESAEEEVEALQAALEITSEELERAKIERDFYVSVVARFREEDPRGTQSVVDELRPVLQSTNVSIP